MDVIGHLIRTVTPVVLGNNRDPKSESLLEQFYAIFAAKLADDDSYSHISTQEVSNDDHGLFDRVWTDEVHKNSITHELAAANNVEESSVKGLIATAAPLVLHELKTLAGATTVPQFLRNNLSTYRDLIPAWAAAILPASYLAGHFDEVTPVTGVDPTAAHVQTGERISNTTSTAPLHREEKKEGGFLKALLPIIGLIILGALAWALLKGCQDNPQPVAAPADTVEQSAEEDVAGETLLEPAVLTLATGEGSDLYACRINAGNDGLATSVTDAVKNVFATEADKCRSDINDDYATDMPAAAHLDKILPLVKNTPNANVVIKGNEIRVDAPDATQLDKLVSDLQAAAPDMNVVAEGPLNLDNEIQSSIDAATAAMDRLGDNPDPRDVARALSLQVINFEVDKAIIPDVNKAVLDRSVDVMKQVPEMKLMILGHTDSQASDAYNNELSQRRAQAVKDYLVSKGADESKLMIKGMGEADPIATNETEQGRFRNRRIEFKVYDETMEADNAILVAEDSNVKADPDMKPLDANNNDGMPDPDMNPLDADNDDIMPDQDDPSKTQ